jgi:hypothetical protein
MADHDASSTSAVDLGPASLGRVLRDQRKTIVVAVVLAAVAFWVLGQLDEWVLADCIAGGVALGLLNHLATEYWLLHVINDGSEPSRSTMVRATMVRLAVLTVTAVALAVLLWPDGIGLLLGLAIFRLIALALTALPLLKELKNQ